MQELMGRVTSLDPTVSESFKVISYFDALVAGGVNLETLVRGAAALSGAVAGLQASGRVIRVDASGRRLGEPVDGDPAAGWLTLSVDESAEIWLERDGEPHVNDRLVLERWGLGVASVRARRVAVPDDAVEAVMDAARPTADREAAATRLRLDPGPLRVLATSPDVTPAGPSRLVATRYGVVRATISAGMGEIARGGRGTGGTVLDLPHSWQSALIAYRLCDDTTPVVDATEYGVLLDAVVAATAAGTTHPDVAALASVDPHSRSMLHTLARAESVRAAAVAMGMHHSTLQARHEALSRLLGYDPRTPLGRTRYEVARILFRLSV
jgi:hypothetical protein